MLNILVTLLLLRIAYIDYKTMRIPDKLNLAIMVCGLISCIQNTEIYFIERMIGFLIVSVPMYMICLMIPEAFGGGDIKLTAVMGFFLGWKQILVGAYLSFLIGGAQAVWLLAAKKIKQKSHVHMAFGPALCLGMWIAMIWGKDLIGWYFELFI